MVPVRNRPRSVRRQTQSRMNAFWTETSRHLDSSEISLLEHLEPFPPGLGAWESVEAFQTEISCCHSHFDLTHSETFENCHCLWIEIVNHFVMTEKMFVNSPLLAGTVSVGWRQENLDWCKSVKRSGCDRIGGWRWGVPWGERSLRQLQGPCGGIPCR